MTAQTADIFTGYDLSKMKQGFSDPVMDAQAVFRKVLESISYPGRIIELKSSIESPAPLNMASAAIFLALADFSTPVWTDSSDSAETYSWFRFHCCADIVINSQDALFAVITDPGSMPDLSSFNNGTDQRPDLSTTLIIQASGLSWKKGRKISGPGMQRPVNLNAEGIPEKFWIQRRAMEKSFPNGLDVFFTCGDSLVALPRTAAVNEII